MAQYGLPYVLEDKTGLYNSTEYDDIYDRMFIGITSTANVDTKPTGSSTVKIFELGSRTSLHAYPSTYPGRDPTVILDFGPNSHLGTILFVKRSMSMPMSSWIKKTSFFGRYIPPLECWLLVTGPHALPPSHQIVVPKVPLFRWPCVYMELSIWRRRGMDGELSFWRRK